MKKLFIFFIISLGFSSISKADTIDYWQVYYNNSKLKECNGNWKYELGFKLIKLNNTDSITVYYYHDAHCTDCTTNLIVEDETKHQILAVKKENDYKELTFYFEKLLAYEQQNASKIYKVYYYRERKNVPISKKLIFSIKLE